MASSSSTVVGTTVNLFKTISHVSDDCLKVYKIITHCLVPLVDLLVGFELSIINLVYFLLEIL